MGIRPLSAISDLEEELYQLFEEAKDAGLDPDQIVDVARKALRQWDDDQE
jgi:hypothetical protein